MKAKIVCRGYGSPHGWAQGRHWFVCSKCRWAPNYRDPEPAVTKYKDGTTSPIK